MLGWGFRRLLAALVALTALLSLSATAGAADYDWKFQSFWQAATTNQKAFERFAANVGRMSGARIEIEALSVGAVAPPGEMLDAVKVGIIDGINGGTGYFVGKNPAFALLADINAGYENPYQSAPSAPAARSGA